MSVGSEDLPEELLWKGDVDDGDNDLDFFGGDFDETHLIRKKPTMESYNGDEVEDEDDPLGGLEILGSMHESRDLSEEEEEPCSTEPDEDDFVKILEASIQRDHPKVEIPVEFQKMLDAVEEDMSKEGDQLIDKLPRTVKSTQDKAVGHVEGDDAAESEDGALLDIGALVTDNSAHVDQDETEKLNALLEGLMLGSKTGGTSRGRDQIENTFWQLQAVCSKILQARENIEEYQSLVDVLRLVLRHADPKGLQECLDYILFPFGIILDAFVSNHGRDIFLALKKDSSVCDTLQCLEMIVSKTKLDEGQIISLTQRLSSMLSLSKERLSEEPRRMISCLLGEVFEQERFPKRSNDEYRPWVGSIISILLCHPYNDVTDVSSIKIEVQKASMTSLGLFLKAVGNADSLAFFVPGIMTGLVKRIMVQIDENIMSGVIKSKNSSGVIASLQVMQELFMQIFSDGVVECYLDEDPSSGETVSNSEMYHSMLKQMASDITRGSDVKQEDSAEVLQELESHIQTNKEGLHVKLSWNWIKASVIRISTFLQIIIPKLCVHENPEVRLQLANMGSCILNECSRSFKDNTDMVDAMLLLGQDTWPLVKSVAGSCLSLYFEQCELQSLPDMMDVVSALPNVLKKNERQGKAAFLRICSYIEYSHQCQDNFAFTLLGSAESRDLLLDHLSSCIEIDLQSLLIVARGPSLAIMGVDNAEPSQVTQTSLGRSSMPDCLKYISSKDTYKAFASMIHLLVKRSLSNNIGQGKRFGSSYAGLIASCLKIITDISQSETVLNSVSKGFGETCPWQIETSKIILLLTEILDGSIQLLESEEYASCHDSATSCCKNAVLDILYTLQEKHIWLLKTSFPKHNPRLDDMDILNSIVQHYCLDLIGVSARCIRMEFTDDGACMSAAMLPVIEKFASGYQYVSASAKNTIQCICMFCGYTNGLEELIQKNIDYVVDGMCLRLRQPATYPDAPKLFAALLKQNGVAVALTPLLSEPAEHAIRGISIIQRREKPENVLSFVLCTLEIAQGTYTVATSAHDEMEALAHSILQDHLKEGSEEESSLDEEPENPSIDEIGRYFQTKRKDESQNKHILFVSLDVWESVMLCRKRLSSAATLAQCIADSIGPLSVSKSLTVAVQSFKAAVKALQALDRAHEGMEIFKKQLEEAIKCQDQLPVVDTKTTPTFLPSIHLLWTPLMGSLSDWRAPVLEEAIECLTNILLLAPGFLARRFTKDAWPKLRAMLQHGAPRRNLIVPGNDDTTSPALDARIQRAVLHMILQLTAKLTREQAGELLLPISRETLRDIIYLSEKSQERQHSTMVDVQGILQECYAALAQVNPDAAWIILYEHGAISHGINIKQDISDVKPEEASRILAEIPDIPTPTGKRFNLRGWEDSVLDGFKETIHT